MKVSNELLMEEIAQLKAGYPPQSEFQKIIRGKHLLSNKKRRIHRKKRKNTVHLQWNLFVCD